MTELVLWSYTVSGTDGGTGSTGGSGGTGSVNPCKGSGAQYTENAIINFPEAVGNYGNNLNCSWTFQQSGAKVSRSSAAVCLKKSCVLCGDWFKRKYKVCMYIHPSSIQFQDTSYNLV